MEALQLIGTIPERRIRAEFEMLVDEPVYSMVKTYASKAYMQEIDGWARSFFSLEGHIQAIAKFSKPLIPPPADADWAYAKSKTTEVLKWSIPMIRSLTFESDLDQVHFESQSAAGYGYAGKKGEGDNLKRAKKIANAAVRKFKEDMDEHGFDKAVQFLIDNGTPDIAFTRTQLARLPSIKVRNVFGEAFHYILIEGLAAQPLLQAFEGADTFYFTGKDPKTEVPRLLYHMGLGENWFICLDWQSFHASVQMWEIDYAFEALESRLEFPTDLSYYTFLFAKESFKVCKLASPDGSLYIRRSGIPSGSYFTNIIGSIVSYARIMYISSKMGWNVKSCYVQGDDSLFVTDATLKPDIFAILAISQPLGWALNLAKCTMINRSDEVNFLGKSQMQLFNIRERLKVLRLMCFPEFKVESPKISTARVRMIARNDGFNDPLYCKIFFGLKQLYGEEDRVPPHLASYVDRFDFVDINM